MEDIINKTIETYEKIAESYSKLHLNIDKVKFLHDRFLEAFKGYRILDVGCGPGRDAKYFSENGFNVVGVDLSTSLLKIAKEQAPRAKFVKADMKKLCFPNELFDGLWACASLLHVPKKETKDTLMEFRRVLKHNGLMFVAMKEGEGEMFVGKENPRFFSLYSQQEFQNLIQSGGFKLFNMAVRHDKQDAFMWTYSRKV